MMFKMDIPYIYHFYRVKNMRVAVIGSRKIQIDDLGRYLPDETTEIVSGGAKGVDTCAKEYALANDIRLTEFFPDYRRYGRGAPLKRNLLIVENADLVLAFWDGASHGTKHTIDHAEKLGVPVRVICFNEQE